MMRLKGLAVYTAAHLLVDFGCAFYAFNLAMSSQQRLMFILFYNFCAFALQLPLGLIADKLNRNKLVAVAGIAVVAASALFLSKPLALGIVAGIGNALFHVGGGLDVLNASTQKSSKLGVFVSSGAMGLYLGGVLSDKIPLWVVTALLLGIGLLVFLVCGFNRSMNANLEFPQLPQYGAIAVALLLLVVILRSYLGMTATFAWKSGALVFYSVLAVVLGKALGGFVSDAIGARTTTIVSLGTAAVLFLFSNHAICGILALFLFNMTMPITLWAVARILKTMKGFSFGLLTFGLFMGVLPIVFGWSAPLNTPLGLALLTVVSLVLLYFGLMHEVQNG